MMTTQPTPGQLDLFGSSQERSLTAENAWLRERLDRARVEYRKLREERDALACACGEQDARLDVLQALPSKPSAILHTGGGLHAYWLFETPLYLTTETERSQMTQLLRQFAYTLCQRGKEQGWTLDALRDLARVLRPPGTINHKYGTPRADPGGTARALYADGLRLAYPPAGPERVIRARGQACRTNPPWCRSPKPTGAP